MKSADRRKSPPKPKRDRQRFDAQVAELLAEVEKLPAARREQLLRELETQPGVEIADVCKEEL